MYIYSMRRGEKDNTEVGTYKARTSIEVVATVKTNVNSSFTTDFI